ncbi:MAG: enoyl-CoA hydratase/isomerase family protein [Rhizobiales bacterium]|nr:enoyl-CoA hydratase/isomerase family protein [Hyphomicrobiales bacterium]NRB15824.1 enoyl-CoA hydratase/isomerase family protein [Hyphomicrobiales bacterium]
MSKEQPNFGKIEFTKEGQIATILLNRPRNLNAISREMARELEVAAAECNSNDDIRCVVLIGEGERAFCAGTDIKQLDEFQDAWSFRNREDYCLSVRQIRKPVIAAINGYALGGGLEMALSCDIRLAAQNAMLGAPEIKLGWIGGGGMSQMLQLSAGSSNAAKMLLTGDPIDADQALNWGLISEVLPADQLLNRAKELANTIASRAPIAAEMVKLNLDASANIPAKYATQYELDLQAICFGTADAVEGRAAFKEKRNPIFKRK